MSLPRYIGTTAAEAQAYIVATFTLPVFLRIFDMDRNGLVEAGSNDEAAFLQAVERAETEVDEVLGSAVGGPFDFTQTPIPARDAIRQIVAETTPWHGVKFRASMADEAKAPYRVTWKDALARLGRLRADNGGRLPQTVPVAAAELSAGTITVEDTPIESAFGPRGYAPF